MAPFEAKIGCKMQRKRKEKLSFRSVTFLPTRDRKFRKNSKKIQKIKKYHYGVISTQNTVMYSFQAKIGLKKMRNGENKNYRSVLFLPDT